MDDLIKVRCLRPMQFQGRRIEAGQVLSVTAVDAFAAVASTRAEYVHPDDRMLANDAVRAADERATPALRSRLSSWVKHF